MELKPCPFCGGEAEEQTQAGGLFSYMRYWFIRCKICGSTGKATIHPKTAAEAWNYRTAPPNPPLTLDELRQMEGEPVWVKRRDGGPSRWAIFGDTISLYGVYFGTAVGGLRLPYDGYGKTWLAYRRRPEEVNP